MSSIHVHWYLSVLNTSSSVIQYFFSLSKRYTFGSVTVFTNAPYCGSYSGPAGMKLRVSFGTLFRVASVVILTLFHVGKYVKYVELFLNGRFVHAVVM